jgi:hypothetical protein
VQFDGNGGAAGQRFERRAKAALGQDPGMDPVRNLSELLPAKLVAI